MFKLKMLAVGIASLAIASSADASIIGGSITGGTVFGFGTFIELTAPLANPKGPANSVGNDNFDLPNLYGFDEDQNILLAADLAVNVGPDLSIDAGQVVASHYIFFDPLATQRVVGIVNFDSDVIGIITETGLLAASDFLAHTGVNYLNPGARGLEAGDFATISGTKQISVDFTAISPGDYIRVITKFSPGAVPEPGSMAMLGALLIGGGLRLRKLRRN
jgi:hypothetical protein